MKSWMWVVIIIVVVLIVGYLGRHRIKALLGSSNAPATQTQVSSSTPAMSPEASASTTGSIFMTEANSSKGSYLADSKGKTLYVFDKDSKGVSSCYNGCATTWPPFLAPSSDASGLPANTTLVKRNDGTYQYAYNGMPLYYYIKDVKTGDITGDGVGGVWHLVKP